MLRTVLKGKIHRAVVTHTSLKYEGSITIDADLMEAAGIAEHEQVHVCNLNNGARLETYAILGERGSGEIVMNGAAARCAEPGDEVIVMTYALVTDEELGAGVAPRIVLVDKHNKISRKG